MAASGTFCHDNGKYSPSQLFVRGCPPTPPNARFIPGSARPVAVFYNVHDHVELRGASSAPSAPPAAPARSSRQSLDNGADAEIDLEAGAAAPPPVPRRLPVPPPARSRTWSLTSAPADIALDASLRMATSRGPAAAPHRAPPTVTVNGVRTQWLYTKMPATDTLRVVAWRLGKTFLTCYAALDEPLVSFALDELVWRKDGVYGIEFGVAPAWRRVNLGDDSDEDVVPWDTQVAAAAPPVGFEDVDPAIWASVSSGRPVSPFADPEYVEGFRLYCEDAREIARWWETLQAYRTESALVYDPFRTSSTASSLDALVPAPTTASMRRRNITAPGPATTMIDRIGSVEDDCVEPVPPAPPSIPLSVRAWSPLAGLQVASEEPTAAVAGGDGLDATLTEVDLRGVGAGKMVPTVAEEGEENEEPNALGNTMVGAWVQPAAKGVAGDVPPAIVPAVVTRVL
ncbi:hypothetical protein AMAG_14196 [Allomyces macrogynus ATCC 38327]|uniref:Uncharacterized protein n=1 Tax=Allomyces macrogynus (strain ATCC 38327) TaxID=578462 RepID=A0A0L0T4K3_ALLM3|nr:hypothetical protein AMAG_14196 [Allomyces macrogynus ATCC 38327]|eukprot:KNE69641.1 hypothetical protein AMAG_14196 [Allomyces macrogynus ATCC 38327]